MCGKGAQAFQFPAVTYPRKRNLNRIEAEQLVSYAVNFKVFLFTYQPLGVLFPRVISIAYRKRVEVTLICVERIMKITRTLLCRLSQQVLFCQSLQKRIFCIVIYITRYRDIVSFTKYYLK